MTSDQNPEAMIRRLLQERGWNTSHDEPLPSELADIMRAMADDYRERALKILPWICARCAREFPASRLKELTVHHRDGDHHNNPPDGSNWELLCIYCHENEHARQLDSAGRNAAPNAPESTATHRPFADLAERLKRKE